LHLVSVSPFVWALTLVVLTAILVVDLVVVARRPREPTLRESALWVTGYILLAVVFGLLISVGYGVTEGGKFFAGWLTEYSLSIDNLFVFVIIMSRFAVPRAYQQTGLMIGIVLALLMRAVFIALGAAIIARFSWVFYLFGGFLVYTAISLLGHGGESTGAVKENVLIRWARRVLPVTEDFDRARLTTRRSGRRMVTPMLIVVVALGTTDLIFALDSIPAIFGLTKEPYLVFTANVLALMGLRQLYFLLGGLLDRLVYLSYGLAVVLGFIGVKLVLEALHDNDLPFINAGRELSWAPEIPIWLSLTIILSTLATAATASLVRSRRPAVDRTPDRVGRR
jgi:tellurite resistance protein TerC